MIRALMVVALLAGCNGNGDAGRYDHIDTCEGLFQAFEAESVPETAAGRKELGDEYRARFRELDCDL